MNLYVLRTGDRVLIKAKLDNVTLETDENIIQSSDRTIIFGNYMRIMKFLCRVFRHRFKN